MPFPSPKEKNSYYRGCLFAFILVQNLEYINSIFLSLEIISVFIQSTFEITAFLNPKGVLEAGYISFSYYPPWWDIKHSLRAHYGLQIPRLSRVREIITTTTGLMCQITVPGLCLSLNSTPTTSSLFFSSNRVLKKSPEVQCCCLWTLMFLALPVTKDEILGKIALRVLVSVKRQSRE